MISFPVVLVTFYKNTSGYLKHLVYLLPVWCLIVIAGCKNVDRRVPVELPVDDYLECLGMPGYVCFSQ